MIINNIDFGITTNEGYKPVKLSTSYGNIKCRYYQTVNPQKATIFVGGIGGGFDTPAKNLYPKLCQELIDEKINSLRVEFRNPSEILESVFDVLAGITFLKSQGANTVGLVGHSFGGSVVIQAGVIAQDVVKTIITLSTQCLGTEYVDELKNDCSILLIHGTEDKIVPSYCSSQTYEMAHDPKELILYGGTDHTLNEVAEEVKNITNNWLIEKLYKEHFI